MRLLSSPLGPPKQVAVASDTVIAGPLIPALDRIKLFSCDEWEDFVLEWADSLRSHYSQVERCGGAGDMGRDVIAMDAADPTVWDNYQCKHYVHALRPSDIWIEMGKLMYYTYQGEYALPRAYFFVSPLGTGTTLSNLLRKPASLKQYLKDHWDTHCRNRISTEKEIPLDSGMLDHVESIDYSIFKTVPPLRLIDEHAKTRWHVARFGGGLPPRPEVPKPPHVPDDSEAVYISKLWDAYAEHVGEAVHCLDDLEQRPALIEHLGDSRVDFFSAEALRSFSRDTLPPRAFEALQDEILSGVRDESRKPHPDGYFRVVAVAATARSLQLTSHALISKLTTRDRGGICHQLANEHKLTWARKQ